MRPLLRSVLLFVLLAAAAAPARAADPVLMFLFSIVKEVVAGQLAASARAPEPQPLFAETYPGTLVAPGDLRRLIDESFTYLGAAQRGEIFEALHAELLKPENAAVRASMIEYFAQRALAVRAAQERLAQLTPPEQDRIAAEFRREVAGLPEEDRARLHTALQNHLLPVPHELNAKLLAALPAQQPAASVSPR